MASTPTKTSAKTKPPTKPLTKKGWKGKQYDRHGNDHAKGKHTRLHGNFITQQLLAKLNDPVDRRAAKKDQKTYYAKLVDKVVELAVNGDMRALEFIWERVEGKVPNQLTGTVLHEHQHRMAQQALEALPDKDLDDLERITRKLLEAQGHKVIDGHAEEIH